MKERTMTAKDVASVLGISPQALRLYDERGKREYRYRRDDNGYRRFYHEDLSELFGMRMLIKAGVGMKEAARLCESTPLEHVADAYSSSRRRLEDEISYLSMMKEALSDVSKLIGYAIDGCDDYRLVTRPAMWYLPCDTEELYRSNAGGSRRLKNNELARKWSEHIPASFLCSVAKCDSFFKDDLVYIGLGIEEKYDSLLTEEMKESALYLPERRCAGGVLHVGADWNRETQGNGYQDTLSAGFDFLERNGLNLAGDIFARLIASNVRDSVEGNSDCWYAWFPCE